MPTQDNITLKGIVDGYFKTYSRTPKHSYTEASIYQVIADAMKQLAGLLNGGGDINDFYVYLNDAANYYGVNMNEAAQYLKNNPSYAEYIMSKAKNSGYYDNSLASILAGLGKGIGNTFSEFALGLIKGLLPIIIIFLVVFFAIPYATKHYNKSK